MEASEATAAKCRSCSQPVAPEQKFCPNCGRRNSPSSRITFLDTVRLFIVVAIIGAGLYLLATGNFHPFGAPHYAQPTIGDNSHEHWHHATLAP